MSLHGLRVLRACPGVLWCLCELVRPPIISRLTRLSVRGAPCFSANLVSSAVLISSIWG